MTRPLRIEFKGVVCHITSRGNARQAIFLDKKDFVDFLSIFCSMVKRYHFILYIYFLLLLLGSKATPAGTLLSINAGVTLLGPAVASLYSPPQKNKVRLFIIRGEALRGKEKLRSIHPLLYKHNRGYYRDPLSLAPPLFANLLVILLSFVI